MSVPSSDEQKSATKRARAEDISVHAESGNFGVHASGWFSEVNDQWPGQALSLQVKAILWDKKSKYQHVQVFETETWGRMLCLDGVIQVTEKDEFAYQEMMTHIPLFSHPNPERVLIIGGGDGGVIREAAKHVGVKEITICEIDQMVMDCTKTFFPTFMSAWEEPRLNVFCGDGAEFMRQPKNLGYWDVIITDSSDPVGPAEVLFQPSYYQTMCAALRPGGKVCTQAENIWNHLDLIKKLVDGASAFEYAEYAVTQVPTYPCGMIGFLVCTKADACAGKRTHPSHTPVRKDVDVQKKCKYYTPKLHSASFVLPAFVERKLYGKASGEE